MKRFLVIITLIAIPFFSFGCKAAEGDFYCSYSAKSDNSSLFYIDVYCKREISAAVFDLRFDGSTAEYREVSAESSACSISSRLETDRAIVAFATDGVASGRLCRFTFKSVRSGDCAFTLHMNQACDGDLNHVSFQDSAITVRLGKESDPSSGAASSASGSSSSKTTAKKSGSKSSDSGASKSGISYISEDDDSPPVRGGTFDFRKNNVLLYVMLGAGGVIFTAALLFSGFMLGRKSKVKRKASGDNDTDDPELTDEDQPDI